MHENDFEYKYPEWNRSGHIYESFSVNITYETHRRHHQVKYISNARQLFPQIVSAIGIVFQMTWVVCLL